MARQVPPRTHTSDARAMFHVEHPAGSIGLKPTPDPRSIPIASCWPAPVADAQLVCLQPTGGPRRYGTAGLRIACRDRWSRCAGVARPSGKLRAADTADSGLSAKLGGSNQRSVPIDRRDADGGDHCHVMSRGDPGTRRDPAHFRSRLGASPRYPGHRGGRTSEALTVHGFRGDPRSVGAPCGCDSCRGDALESARGRGHCQPAACRRRADVPRGTFHPRCDGASPVTPPDLASGRSFQSVAAEA